MWFSSDLFQKMSNDCCHEVSDQILDVINSKPNVQKIAEIRRRFIHRGATQVFASWRVSDTGHHAYTYNKGARSELQANIGIWDEGIRLGYGFDPTGAMFGEPEKDYKFLNTTITLLQDCNSATNKIWKTLSPIYAEQWVAKIDDGNDIGFNLRNCMIG